MTNLFIHPYFMQVLKKELVSVYFFQSWMEDNQFCKRKQKREKCWMAEFFFFGKPFCLSFFFFFFLEGVGLLNYRNSFSNPMTRWPKMHLMAAITDLRSIYELS